MAQRVTDTCEHTLGKSHRATLHRLVGITAIILHSTKASLANSRIVHREGLLKQVGLTHVTTAYLILSLGIELPDRTTDCFTVVTRLPERPRAFPDPRMEFS